MTADAWWVLLSVVLCFAGGFIAGYVPGAILRRWYR